MQHRNEGIRDFLERKLPPGRTDQASFLTDALLEASARYDRYAASRNDWFSTLRGWHDSWHLNFAISIFSAETISGVELNQSRSRHSSDCFIFLAQRLRNWPKASKRMASPVTSRRSGGFWSWQTSTRTHLIGLQPCGDRARGRGSSAARSINFWKSVVRCPFLATASSVQDRSRGSSNEEKGANRKRSASANY